MRVLQVVTHMNRGGLETMLMNYYRQIDRSQIQFDFLVHRTNRCDYDDEIKAMGGIIYRLPVLNPFSNAYRTALCNFFKEHPEYQVVHVHQDCLSSVILKEAKKHGVSIRIAHSHSASQDKNLRYLIKLYYRRWIPKYATHLLACGEEAGQWMFQGAKFEVLNNAINARAYSFDSQKRQEVRECLDVSEHTLLLGHIGRFCYPKNHTFLVDIFGEISKCVDAKLILVGDGELRADVEEKVRALKLSDHVIFTGVRSDIADLLQAMDIFVFPSNYEGLPVTIIEAQAAGLPCLISDKVSIECRKTDLVQQIPLDAGIEVWAEAAAKAAKTKRRDTYEEIRANGFDIQENTERLQAFYLHAAEGGKNVCLY